MNRTALAALGAVVVDGDRVADGTADFRTGARSRSMRCPLGWHVLSPPSSRRHTAEFLPRTVTGTLDRCADVYAASPSTTGPVSRSPDINTPMLGRPSRQAKYSTTCWQPRPTAARSTRPTHTFSETSSWSKRRMAGVVGHADALRSDMRRPCHSTPVTSRASDTVNQGSIAPDGLRLNNYSPEDGSPGILVRPRAEVATGTGVIHSAL